MFSELFQLLNIKKTRTNPYHPQCDGQVERINLTLIELYALNVTNPIENSKINLGLVLIAYRSAVQSSTGLTPHFMLFGREMRLRVDVMYRPQEGTYTRYDYPSEVCMTLTNAYKRARKRLKLAHKRQKDYYDRRTCGSRFFPNSFVWLWSPVVEKALRLSSISHGQDPTK